MKWPKRIIVQWGRYDYARIVTDAEPIGELTERRVYVLAPLKPKKKKR